MSPVPPPLDDPTPFDEASIRALVVEDLVGRFRDEPAHHLVVEEFGVGRGASRADVAVISATGIIGVEIKSAADTVRRLAGQVTWYSRVFDAAVVVMDSSHLQHAQGIVPTWWGLSVVDGAGIHVVRAAGQNPAPDLRALGSLLWIPELKTAVAAAGQAGGTAGLMRADLVDVLVSAAPEIVGRLVREALMARPWVDVGQPTGSVRRVRQPTPTKKVARRARRDNRRARRA